MENKKFASLCVLAYKRPERLRKCLKSLLETADYPYELIINLDAGDEDNREYLFELFKSHKLSKLIFNDGKNRGVGRSFQNCLGLVEGNYIFKIDTDLIFKPHWLSTTIKILDNNIDVGAVSLFDYNHYDPNDSRFKPENNMLEKRKDCIVVKDIVSSVYGFRKEDLNKIVPVEDDGNHTRLGKLAITLSDFVENSGFGVTKSTYVSGTEDHPYKTPTFDKPLIFDR